MVNPLLSAANRRLQYITGFIAKHDLKDLEGVQGKLQTVADSIKPSTNPNKAAAMELAALTAELELIGALKKAGSSGAVEANLELLERGIEVLCDQQFKDEKLVQALSEAGVTLNQRLMTMAWTEKEWMKPLMAGNDTDAVAFQEAMHSLHSRKRRLKALKEASETSEGFTLIRSGTVKETIQMGFVEPALQHHRAQIVHLKMLRIMDVMGKMGDKEATEYKNLAGQLERLKIKYGKTYPKKAGRVSPKAVSLSPYDPYRRVSPYELNWRMKTVGLEVEGLKALKDYSLEEMQAEVTQFLDWVEKNPQRGYAAIEEMIPFVAAAGTVEQVERFNRLINLYLVGEKDPETGLPKSHMTVLRALWPTQPDEEGGEARLGKYLALAREFKRAVASQDNAFLEKLKLADLPVEVSFHKGYNRMHLEDIPTSKTPHKAFGVRLSCLRGSFHLHGYVQSFREIVRSEDFRANAHRWVVDLLNSKSSTQYHHQTEKAGEGAYRVIRFFTDVFKDDDSLLVKFTRVSLLVTLLTGTTLAIGASIALAVLAGSIIPVAGAVITTIFTVVALIGVGFTTWKLGNGIIDLLKEMTAIDDPREIKDVGMRTAYNYHEAMGEYTMMYAPVKKPTSSIFETALRYTPGTNSWKIREQENALLKTWGDEWATKSKEFTQSGKVTAAADYHAALASFIERKMQGEGTKKLVSTVAYRLLTSTQVYEDQKSNSIKNGMLGPDGGWGLLEKPVDPREHAQLRLKAIGYDHQVVGVSDMDYVNLMTIARDAARFQE